MHHFFRQILLKLARNVNNGTNGIPFLFYVKMKTNYYICNTRLWNSFNSADFSRCKVDHIFTVRSLEHREFRSVGISKLPCMVPGLQAFIFIYLPVHAYSVVTYLENVRFLYFKNLQIETFCVFF